MFVITVAGCYKKCYCLSKYTAVVCLKNLEVVSDICSGNFSVSTNTYFAIYFSQLFVSFQVELAIFPLKMFTGWEVVKPYATLF